jgi:hypothetical protein
MIIAVHNFKGGIGSTTIALHLAYLAQKAGHKVGGASVDFKKDLERFLAPLGIPCVDPNDKTSELDHLIMDVQSHTEMPFGADVTVAPITGRISAERALELSDRTRDQVLWVSNMGGTVPKIPEHLTGNTKVLAPIPFSHAIAACPEGSIIWEHPDLADSPGARALRVSLLEVLAIAFEHLEPEHADPNDAAESE